VGDRNHYRPGSRRVVLSDMQVALQATVIQRLRRTLRELCTDHLASEWPGVRLYCKDVDPREAVQWRGACRMIGEYRLKQKGGE